DISGSPSRPDEGCERASCSACLGGEQPHELGAGADVTPAGSSRRTPRLDTAVKFLKGIGERRAEQLERLGIRTARDLLWHLPHRYIDASTVTPLVRAEIGQEVACVGRV